MTYIEPNMLEKLYIEFVNDYLTVAKIAEHKQMQEDHMRLLLKLGKMYHEDNRLYPAY